MFAPDTQERISAIDRKLAMAGYLRDQLQDLQREWPHLNNDALEIRTAALLEGCMHCLHHCLDILGQVILLQHPALHNGIKGNVSLWKVVNALPGEGISPTGPVKEGRPLKAACLELLRHEDVRWLNAFVNYSKHHTLVRLDRVVVVGSQRVSIQGAIHPDVYVRPFCYKGERYGPAFALASTWAIHRQMSDRIHGVIPLIAEPI